MKEKLISEISNAMVGILSVEQMAQLNGVLLQVISNYTISADDEQMQENNASNGRLLEIFLSAKQVEGCTTPTIKYYGSTIKQLFKKMPKKVTNYTTEDIRAYLAVFQRKHKSSKVTIDNIRRIFSSFFSCKALFVSLAKPYNRLQISGIETRLRKIGKLSKIVRVHPHKFRRTLATMAIDKGMPVEQVQKLLGHVKIDTTMHYAMVNQTNVKLSHRKFIS